MHRRELFAGLGAGVLGLLASLLPVDRASAAAYRPMAGSEVLWDRFGVAHVYARSIPDLFYGFGWAQARSHGNLLAKLYAQARGRAAEYYGADRARQ